MTCRDLDKNPTPLPLFAQLWQLVWRRGQNDFERVLGIKELNIRIRKWRKYTGQVSKDHTTKRRFNFKRHYSQSQFRFHTVSTSFFLFGRYLFFLFGWYFSWLHNDENTWHKLIDNMHQAGKGQKTKGAQRNAGKWWRMHHGRLPWGVDWGKEGGGYHGVPAADNEFWQLLQGCTTGYSGTQLCNWQHNGDYNIALGWTSQTAL